MDLFILTCNLNKQINNNEEKKYFINLNEPNWLGWRKNTNIQVLFFYYLIFFF
jgi:hypothetical protein